MIVINSYSLLTDEIQKQSEFCANRGRVINKTIISIITIENIRYNCYIYYFNFVLIPMLYSNVTQLLERR